MPGIWQIVQTLIIFVNIIAVFLLVFFEKKNTTSILLWSVILLILPFLGLILYTFLGKGVTLGKNKKFLNKYTEDERYKNRIECQKSALDEKDLPDGMRELIHYNLSSGALYSSRNTLEIFSDVSKLYKDMAEEIGRATKCIHMEYFIIRDDKTGRNFISLLTKKAAEGVKVRLLYDDIGCFRLSKTFFDELRAAGGEVFAFFPSRFKFINRNLNYRNHRKILVVDNACAYTGGSNIGEEYIGGDKSLSPWTDCNIKVCGEAALHLNLRFLQDFGFASKKSVQPERFRTENAAGNCHIQIISDGPDTAEGSMEQAYIKAIYSAKKSVYIQTPYLVPDDAFFFALSFAAKSGIDVRIMIPENADKKYVYHATLSYAAELVKEGVKVYKRKGFLHSKTLVADDILAAIGTFNIDMRSFYLQFENAAFIYDSAAAQRLKQIFENDMAESRQLTLEDIKKTPLLERAKQRVMRLLTPIF